MDKDTLFFSNLDLKRMIAPLFLEQLLAMLVGAADTFMVSYAGNAAVSGVSLVNMAVTIFIYLFTALAAGGAVVASQYIGNQNREAANRSAGQLLLSSALISVIAMAPMLIWGEGLLKLLFRRIEPDIMDACTTYLQITAFSYPALAVYNAGAALCRSNQRTDLTMKISVAANLINVAGNAVGIFILEAGVAVVAYPTLIARVFSAAAITVLCFDKRKEVFYQWRDILTLDIPMTRRILRIAVPNGLENGLFQLTKAALGSIAALFGAVQIAANGIAQSFWSLAAVMGVSMGPAFITVIGQCMGNGDTEAAEYYFKKLYRMTLIASIFWTALTFAITPLIMWFYPLSDEIARLVVLLALIHNLANSVLYPASGALSNGLRAAGDVRFTMWVSLISTLAVRFALSVALGIWMELGVVGVAIAMCCDWGVRAALFLWRFRSGKWKEFSVIERR